MRKGFSLVSFFAANAVRHRKSKHRRKMIMKKGIVVGIVVIVMSLGLLCLLGTVTPSTAGEKEEAQARLVALLQEERAMNAEFELYKAKMAELQNRLPNLKTEKEALAKQLKAIEDKEKAAKAAEKPAPAKPATTK